MQRLLSASVAVLVLAFAGCNNSKLYGRIVGFVVDGVTGKRLNAFATSGDLNNLGNDNKSPNEVFAVIQGRFVRAEPCGQGDANKDNLITADGCYKFENVPANQDVPVFAQFTGYDRFQGKVKIITTAVTVTDIVDADPQKIANIMLWPLGFQQDYSVLVLSQQQPVPNAQINCQADPTFNQFETSGDFIVPEATTLAAVHATTGSDGTAVLSGASLVNGAEYFCSVFLPTSFQNREVQDTFSFSAGIDQPQLVWDLSVSGPGDILYAVRSNNDDTNALLGLNANLVITLNQPAQIVPGSEDCMTAVLFNPDTDGNAAPVGALPTPIVNNGSSEQVNASISGDGLTLTLSNKAYTTPPDTGDYGTTLSFSGVYLRPTASSLQKAVFRLGAATAPIASTGCTLGNAFGSSQLFNNRTGATQRTTLSLF